MGKKIIHIKYKVDTKDLKEAIRLATKLEKLLKSIKVVG